MAPGKDCGREQVPQFAVQDHAMHRNAVGDRRKFAEEFSCHGSPGKTPTQGKPNRNSRRQGYLSRRLKKSSNRRNGRPGSGRWASQLTSEVHAIPDAGAGAFSADRDRTSSLEVEQSRVRRSLSGLREHSLVQRILDPILKSFHRDGTSTPRVTSSNRSSVRPANEVQAACRLRT